MSRLRRFFQVICGGTEKLYIQRIPAGPRTPALEAHRFDQRVVLHLFLERGGEGKAGIGAQIGINEFDRNPAQLIGVLGVCTCQAPAGITPHLPQHEFQRVGTVGRLVFRTELFGRPLHLAHHRHRVGPGGTGRHGEIAGDAAPVRAH